MTTKIDVSKLEIMPVPSGHKIKYLHHYRPGLRRIEYRMGGEVSIPGPLKLIGTTAWLENAAGERVCGASSWVRKGDTPIKKLGRIIAHNRCIKAFVS